MSDVAPPKDAFVEMMAATKDPWYTMVIYRAWLEHADPEEPLWRTPYFGQTVRPGTAEEVFKARKGEHETGAAREDKDLGFHAVLATFGSDAIEWEIVSSKSGPRTAMQELANAEEKRLIAAHGGVLRDMDATLEQTLNLTEGGHPGDARARWASIDARCRRALNKFKTAMEVYVEEHGSALVPNSFVAADGYKLGHALGSFRQGYMRKGKSDELEINAWADALPKWAWNGRITNEFRERHAQSTKDWWTNASEDQRADRSRAVSEAHHRPNVRAKHVQACKDAWTNASEQRRAERTKANSDAHLRPEVRAASAVRCKNWWANASKEQRADRIAKTKMTKNAKTEEEKIETKRKMKETLATDASKAKKSKSATVQRTLERSAELERARPIAVPFEKSKKRRAEMRAASTDVVGQRGNVVLYMISEDGQTIRRVNKDGVMRERDIVGLVVDPAPPDAFDSD